MVNFCLLTVFSPSEKPLHSFGTSITTMSDRTTIIIRYPSLNGFFTKLAVSLIPHPKMGRNSNTANPTIRERISNRHFFFSLLLLKGIKIPTIIAAIKEVFQSTTAPDFFTNRFHNRVTNAVSVSERTNESARLFRISLKFIFSINSFQI